MLHIMIRPPFWLTWWFRGLCILAFIFSVYAAHVYLVRRLTSDLERRKQGEQALRASEERFSKAFHFESCAYMSITRFKDGLLLDVNESNLNMLGDHVREEIVGRKLVDARILDYEQTRKVYHTLLREGSIRGLECNVRTKSGEMRIILTSAELISSWWRRVRAGLVH